MGDEYLSLDQARSRGEVARVGPNGHPTRKGRV